MHTPLVVRWPGRPPGRVDRRTSHNDVAPTLVTELFGCTNPASDYASGRSLFGDTQGAGSSRPLQRLRLARARPVTVVLPGGYEIRDRNYRLLPSNVPPRRPAGRVHEMSRFYR